jgi:hypothetical protein
MSFVLLYRTIINPHCEPGDWFVSSCKAQITTESTDLKKSVEVTPSNIASHLERKGQFGDSFGVFTSLASAATLIIVFVALWFQRATLDAANESLKSNQETSRAQLELVRLERYYGEIAVAIAAYNNALRAVEFAEKNKSGERWTGTHGMFHLWKTLAYGVAHYADPRSRLEMKSPIAHRIWYGVQKSYGIPIVESLLSGAKSTAWVTLEVHAMNDDDRVAHLNVLVSQWCEIYDVNVYQLDALYRCWYHVCKAIANTKEFEIDAETEWRAASRFRAQLSWIELAYLLANQSITDTDTSYGYAKSRILSERYAIFDNFSLSIDPMAHFLLGIGKGTYILKGTKQLNLSAFSSDLAKKEFGDKDT